MSIGNDTREQNCSHTTQSYQTRSHVGTSVRLRTIEGADSITPRLRRPVSLHRIQRVTPETNRRRIAAMARYTFRLNGRSVTVDAWDPAQPLLYALRGPLALHGPKFGCGLGQCGACTVLVDRTATRSCTLPVSRAASRDITTLEGLGTPDRPDAVQAAFIAEQAAQCGYCTNGMIMAAKALLARTPQPSVEQIKQALEGNLCRCGTHTRIVRAIQRASQV